MNETVTIKRGRLLVYRVFDIAEEVDLRKVEELFRTSSGESRLKLAEKARDAVVVRDSPVRIYLGEVPFFEKDSTFGRAQLYATVWNYGSVSISWHIPFSKMVSWAELTEMSSKILWKAEYVSWIDSQSESRAKEVAELIRSACQKAAWWSVSEDYTIFLVEEIEGAAKPAELLKKVSISQLLVGEAQEQLAQSTSDSILDNLYQYSENDLVVIDWNSAFVFEPSGSREIPDILEFALTHLLEVRYYDDLIDRRLNELYSSIEASRKVLSFKSIRMLAREANARYLEFSEFMERMGNSLKVVGDFYLARIFRGAIRRYRIHDWEENISRKMNLFARVAELLQGEANVRMSHLLEVIIIFLILFEIVTPILKSFF
jgi:hypothetical protein